MCDLSHFVGAPFIPTFQCSREASVYPQASGFPLSCLLCSSAQSRHSPLHFLNHILLVIIENIYLNFSYTMFLSCFLLPNFTQILPPPDPFSYMFFISLFQRNIPQNQKSKQTYIQTQSDQTCQNKTKWDKKLTKSMEFLLWLANNFCLVGLPWRVVGTPSDTRLKRTDFCLPADSSLFRSDSLCPFLLSARTCLARTCVSSVCAATDSVSPYAHCSCHVGRTLWPWSHHCLWLMHSFYDMGVPSVCCDCH